MPRIEVDPDVMSLIWSLRREDEASESAILRRILSSQPNQLAEVDTSCVALDKEVYTSKGSEGDAVTDEEDVVISSYKVRWVDDVQRAFRELGGAATLHEVYQRVERIRKNAGRSCPKTLDATIRRTIEDHSSDSDNFRGVDLFKKIGRGHWALRT